MAAPLLVSDGTPDWLRKICLSMAPPRTAEKALMSALVAVALETGFYLENSSANRTGSFDIAIMKELPSVIKLEKTEGSYKVNFGLTGSTKMLCLVGIPIGTVLTVNLVIPGGPLKVETLLLNTEEFVDANDQLLLKNHKKLADSFRTHILSVKSRMLPDEINCHHILHLPVEILTTVCGNLSPQEFVNFGKTCRKGLALLEVDGIWKTIARRFFPSRKTSASESWKDFTVYQVTRQKQQEHRGYRPPLYYYRDPFIFLGPI